MFCSSQLQRSLLDSPNFLSGFFRVAFYEIVHQNRNALVLFAERGRLNREKVEPVKQVGSKCPCVVVAVKSRLVAAMTLRNEETKRSVVGEEGASKIDGSARPG